MMNNHTFPNLLIIGAMKCGTTSLHNYLNQHPDIFMSENKEPQYFCKERDQEFTDWYQSMFDFSYKYCGESSIDYTKCQKYQGVPSRIKKLAPNAKFIYIVREPIERMISEYQHLKWKRHIDDKIDINTFFSSYGSSVIQTSNYYKQISVYLENFDKGQILFLKYEDLRDDPYKVLNKIATFLKLSEFPFGLNLKRYNDSKRKVKLTPFMSSINKLFNLVLDNAYGEKVKEQRIIKGMFYIPAYREEKLNKELELEILKSLKKDLKKFAEISGIHY